MNEKKKTLYDQIIGVSNKILKLLKDKAQEAGYAKISLHGINATLNKLLKRKGFETKEKIDDWFGNEAEYMELEL